MTMSFWRARSLPLGFSEIITRPCVLEDPSSFLGQPPWLQAFLHHGPLPPEYLTAITVHLGGGFCARTLDSFNIVQKITFLESRNTTNFAPKTGKNWAVRK